MLIGNTPKRPDIKVVRRIKGTLFEALGLPDNALVTITQLACLEEGCPPVETVFGLIRAETPQLQHKIHKETEAITAEDLVMVCQAWGFSVQISDLESSLKET